MSKPARQKITVDQAFDFLEKNPEARRIVAARLAVAAKVTSASPAINIDNILTFLACASDECMQQIRAALTPQPTAADAAAVIDLCEKHRIPAYAGALIKAKLPLEQVQARISTIRGVQQITRETGVDVDAALAHLDNPMQMLRIAVTNALASKAPRIHSYHCPGNTSPASELSTLAKSVYQDRARSLHKE